MRGGPTNALVRDPMSVLWVAAAEAMVESIAEVTSPVAEAARASGRASEYQEVSEC